MVALALALTAGVVLAIQNVVLSSLAGRGLPFPAVLLLNTLVGFALLMSINVATTGAGFIDQIRGAWTPWYLVPGLLGTFVVFAMVFGFSRVGAAMPTIGLIAGQILAAVAIDAFKLGPTSRPLSLTGTLGALLVAAGAIIVVWSRR